MSEIEDVRITRAAYDEVAQLYTDLVRGLLQDNPYDRALLGIFAELIAGDGPVAEVGCGPGRITAYLNSLGRKVFGVDISPEMIRLARAQYPDLSFEVGAIEELPIASDALAGLVAWYSIIHTPPARIPAVLGEFGRVMRSGAPLLLAFQGADEPHSVQEYDHKVAPSYRWSADALAEVLGDNGFQVQSRFTRIARPDERTPQAALIAIRN
ncbi:class I SAM-dependent methyltransferase [Nocardia inohanensis]|uniref:class I SAM-dependent methyltransferase n=1 Tax=Nocardia inohanensis TaxID=209246 RepID=UPI00082BC72A|nr:class I SAM-dependent methyltransferase [Nocardia inohanensis]